MHHTLKTDELGPRGAAMAQAIQSCVHCGFCLPTCPTYRLIGEERDSPRGRIVLMREVLQGTVPMDTARPHLDACLGCLSCETACPSGVQYRELISPFRDWAREHESASFLVRVRRAALLAVLPHRGRFAFFARLGAVFKPLRRLLPKSLQAPLALLPDNLPPSPKLETFYPAEGKRRAKVALLAGCAQQVIAPEINAATIRLLQRQGVDVHVPPKQGCCGALGWHLGQGEMARQQAIRNLEAFDPSGFDAIISNAAGCGSALHEYPLILAGTDHVAKARQFSAKVKDLSEFLVGLPFLPPSKAAVPVKIVVQDACHLLHGQRVQSAPRKLLRAIPGVELVESADPDICCGSAGTYNVDHPELASQLGQQKAKNLTSTGATLAVTGNIGCQTQLRAHLPPDFPIQHLAVVLDRLTTPP